MKIFDRDRPARGYGVIQAGTDMAWSVSGLGLRCAQAAPRHGGPAPLDARRA
jgi:hypothetical protein